MPSTRSTQSAFANVAASQTDSVVVAASTGKRIRVLNLVVVNGDTAASTVVFNTKPAGAGSAITATFKTGPNGVMVLGDSDGWFQTNPGEGLTVTTGAGAATAVAILVSYTLVN
jgi:hypothetical protein